MSRIFQAYGVGEALIPVFPSPQPFQNAPTSSQNTYDIGQIAFTPPSSPTAFYMYGGGGNWIQLASNTGDILAINGTANQITAVTTLGTTTLSLPAAITAPGSLTVTSGFTVSAGTSSITGTTNINTSGAGVTSIGTGGMGATNIGNATGNTAVTGTLTSSAGITATTGNITATAGNFVSSTIGNGIVLNSGTTSGTTAATLNGRSGQITITTPTIGAGSGGGVSFTITNSAITGSSTQILYTLSGGTLYAALSIYSVTNSAGQSVVVLQNATGATASSASVILTFLVLN